MTLVGRSSLLFILAGITSSLSAQIVTTASSDASALASALVAGASGITINNATYTGASAASGFFTGGSGILPFSSGILLTSGDVSSAPGPNTSDGLGGDNGAGGYAPLTTIASQNTFNASVLSINFTPINNIISFQFVFASEEYNEYVNQFNDVFAFFLNGTNIALLPGTSTPISINTVNKNVNPAYYTNNDPTDGPPAHNIQYDGLVGVSLSLYASGMVNAGVMNNITLAIADSGDEVLDSAVFFAAGSLTDQPPPVGEPGAVPEPSTYAAFGALALIGLVTRRHVVNRRTATS